MESFEAEETKPHVKIEELECLKEIKEEILESTLGDLPIDNGGEEIEYFGDVASFGMILNPNLEKFLLKCSPFLDFPVIEEQPKKSKKKIENVVKPKKANEPVLCYECGGVFMPKSLKKHMDRAHLNKKNYICDLW